METLFSYQLQDLLLFSPRVYWALVAGNNERWWPLAILAPVAGLILLWLLGQRPDTGRRYALAVAGVAWWFVTWSFLWRQYRDINWAVDWAIAPLVMLGALLMMFALRPGRPSTRLHRHGIGLALAAWGTLGHPLGVLLDDRPRQAADTWLLFPDPLAITTLGIALASLSGWRLALALPVPLAWSLVGGITLLGLGSAIGWTMLLTATMAVLAWLPLSRPGHSQRGTC